MSKSELIISENLSKSFGDNHALVDFSLSVKQGECLIKALYLSMV